MKMKQLTALLLLILAITVTSCGKKESEDTRYADCEEYIKTFDNTRSLDYDRINLLIEVEGELFEELRTALKSIAEAGDSAAVAKAYNAKLSDEQFMNHVKLSENIWRVLELAQPCFSQDNMERFKKLHDPRRVIDMYDEAIIRTLN